MFVSVVDAKHPHDIAFDVGVRVDELPELGIDLMRSVIRYGQWDADADTLGSARFEQVRESIAGRAGATPGGPANAPDWRDWDHLHAH